MCNQLVHWAVSCSPALTSDATTMTNPKAGQIYIAAILFACAQYAGADEPVQLTSLAEVQSQAERYYQQNPLNRPTPAWLASAGPHTCSKPRYPRAGLRDEMQGTTILRFDIDDAGKAINAVLKKSSGHAVLDEAAFDALFVCAFKKGAPAAEQDVSYRFYLD